MLLTILTCTRKNALLLNIWTLLHIISSPTNGIPDEQSIAAFFGEQFVKNPDREILEYSSHFKSSKII